MCKFPPRTRRTALQGFVETLKARSSSQSKGMISVGPNIRPQANVTKSARLCSCRHAASVSQPDWRRAGPSLGNTKKSRFSDYIQSLKGPQRALLLPSTKHRLCLGSIVCQGQALDDKPSGTAQGVDKETSNEGRYSLSVKDLSALGEQWVSAADKTPSALDVAAALASSTDQGICDTEEQQEERKQAFGINRLPERKEVSLFELVLNALDDFTVITLIVSGVLSLALDIAFGKGDNDWIEGAAILAAVAVVVLVTAGNDFQKEQQFRELSALSENVQATVIRGGVKQEMSAFSLLVGDVLEFGYGDILPVDGVLIAGNDVRVDESAVTGESDDVWKEPRCAPFMQSGSRVLEGQGRLLVTAVGLNSQQGQIFDSLGRSGGGLREETALEKKLDRLAGQIGQFGLGAGVFSFAAMAGQFTYTHFVAGEEPWQWDYVTDYLHFLITSITILVVAIPEGLPLAVTVALAYSVKRMLKDNNLVRRLSAAETMGCATTICTDKTGTLTQNEMTVTCMWVGGRFIGDVKSFDCRKNLEGNGQGRLASGLDPSVISLLNRTIALNCTASVQISESGELLRSGNRTECAMLELALKLDANFDEISESSERVQVIPFSSERKRMTTVCRQQGNGVDESAARTVFTKGAAEIMLPLCDKSLRPDGSVQRLEDAERQQILTSLQKDGNRLILVASRDVVLTHAQCEAGHRTGADELEQQLTLVAIVGISDPLRPEVVSAIEQCNRAGITVRMLTGDNAVTAASIAEQAGILEQEVRHSSIDEDQGNPTTSSETRPQGTILEGQEFRRRVLDDSGGIRQDVFDEVWAPLRVLARCSPTDKLTIVRGLQSNPDEVVCMTGDGTNDAPALKAADVGFAMNNGTSIAKEAADILLLDSNMLSIVKSVLWGRNVYAGITKFLQFQLVVNVVAVVTACTGAIVAQDSPLKAVQMLWVNLIMDSLASLALATELPSDELLDLPPFSPSASLLTPVILKGIVGQCAFQLLVMYALVFHMDVVFQVPATDTSNLHSSIIFNTFFLMQLVNQVNARYINDEPNVFKSFFDNHLFLGILSGEVLLQVAIVQYGGDAFSTQPLSPVQWAACGGIAACGFLVRGVLLLLPPKPAPGKQN